MLHTLGLVAGHCVERYSVDAAEDAVFDVRVVAHQAAQQGLDLLTLGAASAVVADRAGLGKTAGTLDKFQLIVAAPRDDVILADAVHRADQRHAREVRAVQLRRHGLQLGAVEHAHDCRLDDIIKMMPQRDFVAAKLLRFLVQVAAAHAGAEVAGRLITVVGNIKDVRLKYCDGDVQQRGVALDLLAVDFIIAGVHDEVDDLKRNLAVTLQFLQELGHKHRILAAGDADGDLVPGLDQLVPLDGHDEGRPKLLAEFFDNAALDFLIGL